MKRYYSIITTILFLTLCGAAFAQKSDSARVKDEKAIRQVVRNLFAAWKAGDAVKWANQFADDVDFTVWNGSQFTGREANIKGHQMIFDTFYKDTNIEAEIRKIRFLDEKVAAALLRAELFRNGKKVEDVPVVLPLLILKKENGKWRIHVFQNTPIINEGDLVVNRKDKKN